MSFTLSKFRSCLWIFDEIGKTRLKLLAKFTQKTKWIFEPLGILMVFQIIYCFFSSISTSLSLFQMEVSRYLASYFCRYQSLSHFPPQQNFASCFFSFRKVWGYATSLISWFINFKTDWQVYLKCFRSLSVICSFESLLFSTWSLKTVLLKKFR